MEGPARLLANLFGMSTNAVTIEWRDELPVVRMDDGKANALNPATMASLSKALDECGDAPAVVLTGNPKRFSGGLDLKVLPTLPQAELADALEQFGALCMRLLGFPRPVIAAVPGHAVAGGAVMLLTCDYRLAADCDCRIGLNEVAIGVPMPTFVVELAKAVLPVSSLRPVVLHGRLFCPREAREVGLIDEVCSPDDLLPRALDVARELSRLPDPAYSLTKKRMQAHLQSTLHGLPDELNVFFTEQAMNYASRFG